MVKQYYISFRDFLKLHKEAFREKKRGNRETCGLLVIDENISITFLFLRNLSTKPGNYKMSLENLEKIRKKIKLHGKKIFGTFHSHPITEAIPGKSDIDGAYRNMLIYDVIGETARLWAIKRKKGGKSLQSYLL